jgi:hypothetical protein
VSQEATGCPACLDQESLEVGDVSVSQKTTFLELVELRTYFAERSFGDVDVTTKKAVPIQVESL